MKDPLSPDGERLVRAFGAAMRELRLKSGLTLRGLALRSGIPVSQLRRIEAGQANEMLPELRRFLAVPRDQDEASFKASFLASLTADQKSCSNRSQPETLTAGVAARQKA